MASVSESLRVRDLAGQRVVVWGFGTEGKAAARLLRRHVTPESLQVVVDGDAPAKLPEDLADLAVLSGANADRAIARAQIIVKSPGVSPYHGRLAELGGHATITGGTALWFAETGGVRALGVTGSKGKSTTTSLIAHLLSALAIPNVLAGNVGRALLDVLDEQLSGAASVGEVATEHDLTYALELSSFQTAEVRNSPQVGVLTALFPEHLDWHGSAARYYADKANLFAHVTGTPNNAPNPNNAADPNNAANPSRPGTKARSGAGGNGKSAVVANFDNPTVAGLDWRAVAPGTVVTPYGVEGAITVVGNTIRDADGTLLIDVAASQLPGRHNAVNLAGALSALRAYGIDLRSNQAVLQQAAISFVPLAHRLQPVGTIGGRLVIDDSLSTAPQAAVAALAAFGDRPVGIIVGGHDRGLDYEPLATALAQRNTPTWVCGVPLSGERIVPLIQQALREAGNTAVTVTAFDDFDDAVHHAAAIVPEGGVILLSPAAPSFGRFVDYRDRGLHFRALLGIPTE